MISSIRINLISYQEIIIAISQQTKLQCQQVLNKKIMRFISNCVVGSSLLAYLLPVNVKADLLRSTVL